MPIPQRRPIPIQKYRISIPYQLTYLGNRSTCPVECCWSYTYNLAYSIYLLMKILGYIILFIYLIYEYLGLSFGQLLITFSRD